MNLNELKYEVEDKAVEYLNATRLEDLEEMALNQLNKSANNGYVRLHKLEFSAFLNAVRGLQRQRQDLEAKLQAAEAALADVKQQKVFEAAWADKLKEFGTVDRLIEAYTASKMELRAAEAREARLRDILDEAQLRIHSEWCDPGGLKHDELCSNITEALSTPRDSSTTAQVLSSPIVDADEGPVAECSLCGHKTWAKIETGAACGMTQPNGEPCRGLFQIATSQAKEAR